MKLNLNLQGRNAKTCKSTVKSIISLRNSDNPHPFPRDCQAAVASRFESMSLYRMLTVSERERHIHHRRIEICSSRRYLRAALSTRMCDSAICAKVVFTEQKLFSGCRSYKSETNSHVIEVHRWHECLSLMIS